MRTKLTAGFALLLLCLVAAGFAAPNCPDERIAELSRRIAQTPHPRIGTTWHKVRGDGSDGSMLRHDLVINGPWWYGLEYEEKPDDVPERFTPGSLERARARVGHIRALYPHALLIASIPFFENGGLPENHPWYLRYDEKLHKPQWWLKRDGDRLMFWPDTWRMDIANREYQQRIIQQICGLKEAGLDGVFIDNLALAGMALRAGVDERQAWISFFQGIRDACGDDFFIIANGGLLTPWAAPYLNGAMFEGFGYGADTDWDKVIGQMQEMAAQQPEPHIDYIERFERQGDDDGWPGDPERGLPPAKREASSRRWSLALALTIGDYYYLFSDSTHHAHDWYQEYDRKIGLPRGPGERVSSHLWRREFENALVVVNLPGAEATYEVDLPQPAIDSFTDERGAHFTVPPGDGRILIPLSKLAD